MVPIIIVANIILILVTIVIVAYFASFGKSQRQQVYGIYLPIQTLVEIMAYEYACAFLGLLFVVPLAVVFIMIFCFLVLLNTGQVLQKEKPV